MRSILYAMHHKVRAPTKGAGETRSHERCAQLFPCCNMRCAVEMQVSKLVLKQIEISSVNLGFVAEKPVRSCKYSWPRCELLRDALRMRRKLRRGRENPFLAQLHSSQSTANDAEAPGLLQALGVEARSPTHVGDKRSSAPAASLCVMCMMHLKIGCAFVF